MSRNKASGGVSPSAILLHLRRRLTIFIADNRSRLPAAAALGGIFIAGLLLLLAIGPGAAVGRDALSAIEAGRVAERDIVAERELTYIDQNATRLRIEAEEKLVLPVFVLDEKPASQSVERLRRYQDLLTTLVGRKIAGDTLFLSVQSEFPGLLAKNEVLGLSRSPFRSQALSHADSILRRLLDHGIVAPPALGLERFNTDYVELRRLRDGKPESEELPAGRLVTLKSLPEAINEEMNARRLARPLAVFVAGIVRAFAVEDAFFDAEQSKRRLEGARAKVEPVVRTIAKGERIVRKGSIVSEADVTKLTAARIAVSSPDWGSSLGSLGILAAALAMGLFILGKGISGAVLRRSDALLVTGAAFFYFLLVLFLGRFARLSPLDLAFLLPTALLCMLFAVLTSPRFAILYGIVLALLGQAASGLDARLFVLSLFSSSAATFAVRQARSRIDLVKAGLILAILEGGAAALLAAPGSTEGSTAAMAAVWGAANGFLCGLLALGLLPVLEQALNAPTRFRLMELSDLNAPILKRLLTVAPGTYSHSVTVAHLAESACREIGADPLLARVGAYYHDIGKIEQPEYFIENQSGYNKHEEINPRLSATVIRSHVKLGAEKARSLGLPDGVVDIVAQHHGNAVITWFYDQARKAEAGTESDDFTYPGQPPASREAAVVMLADSVEAATRSLKKPTMNRLEEFIRDLIMDKVKQGQLDRCDLTFRDIETIRNSFTRILAGHFHSRIEYPKLREAGR